MKRILLFIMFLSLTQSIFAKDPLTTSFEFLRNDFNARTAATSGAFSTVRGDVGAMLINPAGMAYSLERQYIFNYTSHIVDISGGMVGYSQPVEGFGIISGSIAYFNYGNFEETNDAGQDVGKSFNPLDLAFTVGWAMRWDTSPPVMRQSATASRWQQALA